MADTEQTPLKPLGESEGADKAENGSPAQNGTSKLEKYVPGLAEAKRKAQKGGNTGTSRATGLLTGFEICCGSIFVTLLMIILSALPIAMIVIGAIYLHNCKGRDKIPIWLLVFGVFALFQTIINGMRRCIETCRKADSAEDEDTKPSIANRGGGCCELLISLFLFAWVIVGSWWVFGYWNTYMYSSQCNSGPGSRENCCDPVLYWFSFGTLIAVYAGALLSILICCCCCCCIASVLI